MEPVACINDEWIPASKAGLSLFDAGFTFGATVVETMRTFAGEPVLLTRHVARFLRNSSAIGIERLPDRESLVFAMMRLVESNLGFLKPGEELTAFLFATPGSLQKPGVATWGCYTMPLPPERFRSYFESGVDLVVPKVRQLPADVVDPHIKHRSRMHWYLAALNAAPGLALLADREGNLRETAFGNLIGYDGKAFRVPPRSETLDGIGLQVTDEIIERLPAQVVEWNASAAEWLKDCDEILLTGSAFGVCAVRSIDGIPSRGINGPICRRLQELWSLHVGVDISRQFLISR